MKIKTKLLCIPILLLLGCTSCSVSNGSNGSSENVGNTENNSNDGKTIYEKDGIIKSSIDTNAPTLGYYFAYDTLSSVPFGTSKLNLNIHLGRATHIKDFNVIATDSNTEQIDTISSSDIENYHFKVIAALENKDDKSEKINLGEISIDPNEYLLNDKYEIKYYDVSYDDKSEQNIVFKNSETLPIDLTKLKFDEGRWVIYYVSIKFIAINNQSNAAYLIADNCKYLFHKYDNTKENILFSSFRFDEEIKPGGIKNNGWVVE